MSDTRFDLHAFDRYVTDLFEKSGFPGVSMVVRGPEGIIYEKGFGKRSVEHDLPVDPDTVFGIASMSKSFTTFALAILQTEGKVDFSDPVRKYFPNFHVPGIPDDCVTLRHLAQHTAGIPPIQPLEWSIAMNSIERDNPWSRAMVASAPNKMETIDQVIDYISAGDYGVEGYGTLGSPGEYHSYSNEGYAILSYVVDQVAGMPLEEFLKERVFGPLGMTRTVLDLDGSEARALAGGNITSLFERDEDGKLVWDDNFSVLPPFRGCACMKSTARDLTVYYKMLADRGCVDGVQVFPAEAVEILIGKEFPATYRPHYAFGLKKRFFGGKVICEHYGELHGTSTAGGLVETEEGGYSVVVLTNEGSVEPDPFLWAGYNLILGLPLDTDQYLFDPVGRAFSDPEALVGDYVAAEGETAHCIVTLEDGRLLADLSGTPCVLLHCGEASFVAVKREDRKTRVNHLEFFVRGGKAWGVRCGSRVYQELSRR